METVTIKQAKPKVEAKAKPMPTIRIDYAGASVTGSLVADPTKRDQVLSLWRDMLTGYQGVAEMTSLIDRAEANGQAVSDGLRFRLTTFQADVDRAIARLAYFGARSADAKGKA